MVPAARQRSPLPVTAASPVATKGDSAHGHDEDDDHVVIHHWLTWRIQCHDYRMAEALSPRAEWKVTVPSVTPDPQRTSRICTQDPGPGLQALPVHTALPSAYLEDVLQVPVAKQGHRDAYLLVLCLVASWGHLQ